MSEESAAQAKIVVSLLMLKLDVSSMFLSR